MRYRKKLFPISHKRKLYLIACNISVKIIVQFVLGKTNCQSLFVISLRIFFKKYSYHVIMCYVLYLIKLRDIRLSFDLLFKNHSSSHTLATTCIWPRILSSLKWLSVTSLQSAFQSMAQFVRWRIALKWFYSNYLVLKIKFSAIIRTRWTSYLST